MILSENVNSIIQLNKVNTKLIHKKKKEIKESLKGKDKIKKTKSKKTIRTLWVRRKKKS